MEYLKVNLWGNEIGRLVYEPNTRRTYFVFNLDAAVPDIAPLLASVSKINRVLPIYGDDRPLYQGLPPFIADSLPDAWGNTLFDKWIKDNRVPRGKVTPLYKLMFIGRRGMGALEYEPAVASLGKLQGVDVKALYDLSLNILDNRDGIKLGADEDLTMRALLSVGTSAGGRQMKAILAINNETGEIRSGQIDGLVGYDYCILKFGDRVMPIAEIEQAYYEMAIDAGLDMEPSRLLRVEGVNHFLTRRFDRKPEKVHIQTLAAVDPDARSYEDLFTVCRELSIPESEINQLYVRLVFNVMANNTDDHNKNFSFMLSEGGRWQLAPAYDMTFIFNTGGTGPNRDHRLSVCGKTSDISMVDLLDFARNNDIKGARATVDRVASVIARFNGYAERSGIAQPWRGIIQKALAATLADFGYGSSTEGQGEFIDDLGRTIFDFRISSNAKGHFEISAIIDGKRRRRFVRPSMPIYQELKRVDISNPPLEVKQRLIKELLH